MAGGPVRESARRVLVVVVVVVGRGCVYVQGVGCE